MIAASRLAVATVLLLTACGRTPAGPLPPSASDAPGAVENATPITATIRIAVPLVNADFVVKTTESATVTVYVHARDKKPIAVKVASLGKHGGNCKASKSGRICSVVVDLPHGGNYDFVLRTYDRIPKHGKIPPTAKQLAAGVATRKLEKNGTVGVILGGVVASTTIAVPTTTSPVIDPLAEQVSVEVLDAEGNTIVTNGFVGANGKPVTVALAADASAGGTIVISPSSLTRSPVAQPTLTYAPAHMSNAQATNGFSTVLSATPSNGATAGTTNESFRAPTMTFYNVPTANAAPNAITVGPDNALWFTEGHTANVGRVTTNGVIAEIPDTPAGGNPNAIATGPDQVLWFTTGSGDTIGRMPTSGTGATSFTIPTASSYPRGVTTGPDGALWFTEQSGKKIGRLTTSGTFAEFPLAPGSSVVPIVAGADGALWFGDCGTQSVGRITTAGTINEYTAGMTVFDIAKASDGTMWFSGCAPQLGRITTAGTITIYSLIGDAGGVTSGPDGAVWFTATGSGGDAYIGRMSLDGATLSYYAMSGSNPYPATIVTGPDGALWFATLNGNQIGRLQ